MNATSTRTVVVEAGGTQVVGHVGLHALGSFADRLGVGETLSGAIGWSGPGRPVHDRGRVLIQTMLMLAGGGESCADIEAFASQERLFGRVCSDTTLYRTFTDTLTPDAVERARRAMAQIRSEVWRRTTAIDGDDAVVLDVDATLVEIHSENKDGAGPHYNGGYGFHPLFCFADATGDVLSGMLRAGNAAANNTSDLLAVVDDAVGQLPPDMATGHRAGNDAGLVTRRLVVRSDSAGGTHLFTKGLRARNISFAVVARTQTAVSAAITTANEDPNRWQTAVDQDGSEIDATDDGLVTAVCEVTDLVDLSGWPDRTRLIIRRQRKHPGAQTTLLPDLDYRFWGHYTDCAGDPVELDRKMRAHAHVEDHIQRLKDSGLERFPFTDWEANQAWLQTVMWATDLATWFQLLCLTGPLARAKPRRLRWTFWHAPARIIRTARRDVVRILDGWPTAGDIVAAYQAIAAFT
ncbi:MAG: IS1380 family transposase [Actinomycetota bacterium]|nr:IS1380 family transposase [Actinomycetota bacterium]